MKSTLEYFLQLKDMLEGMKFAAKSAATNGATAIMRGLVAMGVVTEFLMPAVMWRRQENCSCKGCLELHDGNPNPLLCENKILGWRDTIVFDRKLNFGRLSIWIIVLVLASINLWTLPGIAAIVVTVGKNDLLTQYFKGSAYTAAWYVALVDGGSAPTYAAGDTMSSHAGWTENVVYSNSTRVTWTGGTASAGSIDNSGAVATFNMNGAYTVAGGFLTTVSTKSGTTGVLYGEANFTQGNKSGGNGDTIQVTATMTV